MTDRRFRRATGSDAGPLVEVYHSAYRENRRLGFPAEAESVSRSEVAEWIRENRVCVATIEDGVVGGVRLAETGPDRAKLGRLAVHERHEGRGVWSELLEHAEAVARDCGYAAVWLTTPETHPYPPDLYRDRGYDATGPYPLAYREYDEVAMEKRLR